jgi:GT2 family glycosyltransferase
MLGRPFVVTANACIRSSAFDTVGLFDTNLITAEDTDWGWRAYFAGLAMQYCDNIRVKHFHPVTPGGLFHQFYEYGENETPVFLKNRDRLSYRELSKRLWIVPWSYRRTMKTIFFRLPWSMITSRENYKKCLLLLGKEIGYRAGRLHSNFTYPETWKWFRLFIQD